MEPEENTFSHCKWGKQKRSLQVRPISRDFSQQNDGHGYHVVTKVTYLLLLLLVHAIILFECMRSRLDRAKTIYW